jgi:hypothetical protein
MGGNEGQHSQFNQVSLSGFPGQDCSTTFLLVSYPRNESVIWTRRQTGGFPNIFAMNRLPPPSGIQEFHLLGTHAPLDK